MQLTAGVFIDAVQAHERIEDQQAWLQVRDGLLEAGAVGCLVEAHGGGGDDVNIQILQITGGRGADALEPAAHDMQGILGGVEQDPARPGHGEAAQAGGARGDRNGQVQGKEGLAAFGFPPDDADGLLGPQAGDEPALLLGPIGKTVGLAYGEPLHRRRPATLACAGDEVAKSSKNSFSSICAASRCAASASSSPAMFISARIFPWA